MGRTDKDTVPVFGDAATATWFSSYSGAEIGLADFGTDGSGFDNLIVKAGGSRYPIKSILGTDIIQYKEEDLKLYMNGRSILEFMLKKVPASIEKCLLKNRLNLDDIDYFVFHQASGYMLSQLGKVLGLDKTKIPIEIENYGNTVSSTIPITLRHLKDSCDLSGKKVLVSGFGVGLSWATNIITYE